MMYEQIFNMVDIGIVILDKELQVVNWNRWLEDRTRITEAQIKGEKLFKYYSKLDAQWFNRTCKLVFTFGSFAFLSQKLHGYVIPITATASLQTDYEYMQQNCTVGPIRDEQGTITSIFLMIQDVTVIAGYEQKLSQTARIDGLTNVYNRRFFQKKLHEEVERSKRYSEPLSLIMIDLDHFKLLNDKYGHLFGDEILIRCAALMQERLRTSDILARFGGEEFAVLLPNTTLEAAVHAAESIREAIEKSAFSYNDNAASVTISVGISAYPATADNPEELIQSADKALYSSKDKGRNRVTAAT